MLDRFRSWLVTGPVGRGGAFFLDFCSALVRGTRGVMRRGERGE